MCNMIYTLHMCYFPYLPKCSYTVQSLLSGTYPMKVGLLREC